MTRNLKVLGLALVAALALSAVIASTASASPALYTANVTASEQVQTHGEQIGADTLTIGGKVITCVTVKETGFPESAGAHVKGPSAASSTISPEYGTCHVVILFVTKTVTLTVNGCTYTTTATKNTSGFAFGIDVQVVCPAGKAVEIHVYNTSNHDDTGAATLCTFDLTPQTINNQIEATNIGGSPDDVRGHMNAALTVDNTIKSGTCGQNDVEACTYVGTHTLRATNEASQFVNTTIS